VKAVFVTATGTDVGKTFVTAGLVHNLRTRGRSVEALKPVASGFDHARPEASDPGILLDALGRDVTQDALARISPWRFAAPLSPDMAARREGRRIDFDALVEFCRRAMQRDADALLIEGVGGIMVPLDEWHTVLDWMVALRLPLLLVAGSYLGTISHTLSALDVVKRYGLDIAAVVVSETLGSPVGLGETVSAIARFETGIRVAGLERGKHSTPLPELARLAMSFWP
jgi:dethiobiotin synthetase